MGEKRSGLRRPLGRREGLHRKGMHFIVLDARAQRAIDGLVPLDQAPALEGRRTITAAQ